MNQETSDMATRVGLVWTGTVLGGITLADLVRGATLIYTVLQIVVLLRKMWKGKS